MQHMKYLHEYPDHHWHSRKNSPSAYASATVLIGAVPPEAQGKWRVSPGSAPQPSKLSLPPSLGDAQITFRFAAGIGELRESSQCEWPSQPGLNTVVPEAYGCINLLKKLTGTFIQAACTFGLQYKHPPPKSSVLSYYSPWRIKSMTKRFLESDFARIIILLSM